MITKLGFQSPDCLMAQTIVLAQSLISNMEVQLNISLLLLCLVIHLWQMIAFLSCEIIVSYVHEIVNCTYVHEIVN